MPGPAASATNVGAGSPRAGGGARAGGAGGQVRQRGKTGGGGGAKTAPMRAGGTSSGGMWRFYTDDSPGIKVIVSCSLGSSMITLTILFDSGWPRPCPGDVSAVHCLCLHAPHLGQIQQGLDGREDGEDPCNINVCILFHFYSIFISYMIYYPYLLQIDRALNVVKVIKPWSS